MARKIFSSCLAILFVPIFLVTIIVIGVKISAFNPNFYLSVFNKSDFYNQITQNLPSLLSQSFIEGDSVNAFNPLTGEDIAVSIQESINPTWLKENLQKIITNIFNYGSGKTYTIDAIIPLKDIKLSFIDNITQKFHEKISTLPQCTNQQVQEIQSQNLSSTALNCLPSGSNVEELEKQFKDSLISGDGSLINVLPDEYNLNEQFNKNPIILTNIKNAFNYSNIAFYILLTASLILIVIIALINMKNTSVMLKWISIPILISAIFVLISVLFGNLALNTMASGFIIDSTAQIKSLVYALIGTTTKQFFNFYYYCSAILIVLSVVMLIIAIKIGKNSDEVKNPQPEKKLDTDENNKNDIQ